MIQHCLCKNLASREYFVVSAINMVVKIGSKGFLFKAQEVLLANKNDLRTNELESIIDYLRSKLSVRKYLF